jgi:hypothetical protein
MNRPAHRTGSWLLSADRPFVCRSARVAECPARSSADRAPLTGTSRWAQCYGQNLISTSWPVPCLPSPKPSKLQRSKTGQLTSALANLRRPRQMTHRQLPSEAVSLGTGSAIDPAAYALAIKNRLADTNSCMEFGAVTSYDVNSEIGQIIASDGARLRFTYYQGQNLISVPKSSVPLFSGHHEQPEDYFLKVPQSGDVVVFERSDRLVRWGYMAHYQDLTSRQYTKRLVS